MAKATTITCDVCGKSKERGQPEWLTSAETTTGFLIGAPRGVYPHSHDICSQSCLLTIAADWVSSKYETDTPEEDKQALADAKAKLVDAVAAKDAEASKRTSEILKELQSRIEQSEAQLASLKKANEAQVDQARQGLNSLLGQIDAAKSSASAEAEPETPRDAWQAAMKTANLERDENGALVSVSFEPHAMRKLAALISK